MPKFLDSFDKQVTLVLAILLALATVSIAVGAGCLFGAGVGWLVFGFECGVHAKITSDSAKELRAEAMAKEEASVGDKPS